ncbi:2-hydroxyhepta-2,4-diene-1,7-dioate isomerase [Rhodobacterales bacterium 52_120_T64]|nr:2-hydroxyhepta-2,4-diene-1,7-dioate isomerase [Rhodobacterales bacterium 52_120_T64]
MKFLRFGPKGQEKPGCLDAAGNIRDLSGVVDDFAGDAVSVDALDKIRAMDVEGLPIVDAEVRLGSCLASVPNFYCIGLNYARHAAETGATPPTEPIIFSKATSALSGPFDPVVIPKNSVKADWEVELGVVIGKHAEHVSVEDALSYVAGYCVINDMSEREFQIEMGGQWIKGKSAPTFGPTGPYLVTADEVPNPQALALKLSLNSDVQQDSSTSDMIFSVAEIIAYMSRFMALVPGDIIATGTPEGVGMGQKPQRFLKDGDVMNLEIQGLGSQEQTAQSYKG